MQQDGNLVIYDKNGDTNTAIWASNTVRQIGQYKLIMQNDGNLVIYNSAMTAIWASNTVGRGAAPYRLVLEDDCQLFIYSIAGIPTWTSSNPTNQPTSDPTQSPTNLPTSNPTNQPTSIPTPSPTNLPTSNPTNQPTSIPTASPTFNPSEVPSDNLSGNPSMNPSENPSSNPDASSNPSTNPSENPSSHPSAPPITSLYEKTDDDLIMIANAAFTLGLDKNLLEKIRNLAQSQKASAREELKQSTMNALALATSSQFQHLVDPNDPHFVPVLRLWNAQGATVIDGIDQRTRTCDMISSPNSQVHTETKKCVCDGHELFALCMMKLGSDALFFLNHQENTRRNQQTLSTCTLQFRPTRDNTPMAIDELLSHFTGVDKRAMSVKGECSFDLPVPFLEAKGAVEIVVPGDPIFSIQGALDEVAKGTFSVDDLNIEYENTWGDISGKICLKIPGGSDPAFPMSYYTIKDMLALVGIDPCFLSIR
jgi:hypothetical protein